MKVAVTALVFVAAVLLVPPLQQGNCAPHEKGRAEKRSRRKVTDDPEFRPIPEGLTRVPSTSPTVASVIDRNADTNVVTSSKAKKAKKEKAKKEKTQSVNRASDDTQVKAAFKVVSMEASDSMFVPTRTGCSCSNSYGVGEGDCDDGDVIYAGCMATPCDGDTATDPDGTEWPSWCHTEEAECPGNGGANWDYCDPATSATDRTDSPAPVSSKSGSKGPKGSKGGSTSGDGTEAREVGTRSPTPKGTKAPKDAGTKAPRDSGTVAPREMENVKTKKPKKKKTKKENEALAAAVGQKAMAHSSHSSVLTFVVCTILVGIGYIRYSAIQRARRNGYELIGSATTTETSPDDSHHLWHVAAPDESAGVLLM